MDNLKNLKGYRYDPHFKVYIIIHKHKEALVSKLSTLTFTQTSLLHTWIYPYQVVGKDSCFQLLMDILAKNLWGSMGDNMWFLCFSTVSYQAFAHDGVTNYIHTFLGQVLSYLQLYIGTQPF